MKLNALKPNPDNPRICKDEKFKRLCKSITEFPQMMELRPIIYDENMIVLGGNYRLQALKHLGYKEIPDNWCKKVEDLAEQEKRRFIITDNSGFGEWNYDELANSWSDDPLEDWGLDVPTPDFEPKPESGNEIHDCVCSTCGKIHKPG